MVIRILVMLSFVACSPMAYTHGVPNLAQVDTSIYRSGQIATAEGWDYIAKLAAGRKIHVVKLNFDSEGSDRIAVDRGYDVHYLPVQPEGDQDVWDDAASVFKAPDEHSIESGLDVLRLCKAHPDTDFCLGHCTHGQDRTGYLFGRHRVENDGWSKSKAYSEMRAHNFHWELHGVADAWEDWTPPATASIKGP